MRRLFAVSGALVALFIGVVAFAPQSNAASKFVSSEKGAVTLEKSSVHQGAYYAAAQDIVIEGTVDGDLYCVGQTLEIRGQVNGDVICAVQDIEITGNVKNDVRVAGQQITVSGSVGGTLTSFAQDVQVKSDAVVGGDINGAAQNFTVEGIVKKDLAIAAQILEISGTVEGSVQAEVEVLKLESTPAIKGNLSYSSPDETTMRSGAVAGEVKFTIADASHKSDTGANFIRVYSALAIIFIITALVIILIMPRYVERSYVALRKKLGIAFLVGVAVTFGAPVLSLLLLFSGAGVLLSFVLLAVLFVIHVAAAIFTAYYIGRMLFGQVVHNVVLLMFVGSAIYVMLLMIPFVNALLIVTTSTFGVGSVVMMAVNGYRRPSYTINPDEKSDKVVKSK